MSKIYLDMDGVLANFFKKWEDVIGTSYKNIKSQDEFIKLSDKHIKGTNFFLELEPFEHAFQLVENVTKIFNHKPNILSAPIAGDIEHTIKMKTEWLGQHIGLNNLNDLIFTSDKHHYAKRNILIDDHLPNLIKWAKAGGIGIKYKASSCKYEFKDLVEALKMAKEISEKESTLGQIIFLR